MALMDSAPDFTGPVNIGNPDERTIVQLAERIVELTDSGSSIEFGDALEGDPRRRRPDITLAREVLGWEPKIPFETGLIKTIEHFRGNGNGNKD